MKFSEKSAKQISISERLTYKSEEPMFSNINFSKLKKEYKFAIAFTFIFGMLTHLFKFTNTLLNNDSLYNIYARQNIIQSGRWFLEIPAMISSNFDLPLVEGILSIVYISISVAIIISLFGIENRFVIALIGAVMSSYPSVTSIFFYGFTSDAYMMALLLATTAVYLSRLGENKIWKMLLSVILLCLTCGIYQAFFSYALVLIIVYLIYMLLTEEISNKQMWQYVGKQLIIVVTSFGMYFVIWKIISKMTGISAGEYLGASTAGLNADAVKNGLKMSVNSILAFITDGNLSRDSITFYCAANVILIFSGFIILLTSVVKSKLYKSASKLFVLVGGLITSYFCIVVFSLISDQVVVSARMLMDTSVFLILGITLTDKFFNINLKILYGVFIAAVALNYALMANVGYFSLDRTLNQSIHKASEMMVTIHEYENTYDLEKIAFIGEGNDYPIVNCENIYDENKPDYFEKYNLFTFRGDLLFDDNHAYYYLANFCNLDLGYTEREDLIELSKFEEVKNLENWPSDKSITVVDKTLVIRLSENENYWWNNDSK